MDVLDDILNTLDLRGALYFRTDFSGPWAVTVPDYEQAARFHLVIQGSCNITFSDGKDVTLTPGDIVLIPRGRKHILSDRAGRNAPPLEQVLENVGYKNEGVLVVGNKDEFASTQMVCGHFTFREKADHPIIKALPDYLVTTMVERLKEPWLDEMLRLVAQRMFSNQLGAEASVTRLSEIVFIELLRSAINKQGDLQNILIALNDKHIGRALQLIHTTPEAAWSVEKLAQEAGMSRSRFSERFSEMVGTGPMGYLSDWRLQKALAMLESSRTSVQAIAEKTGYQSPAAFTRAFSGRFGVSPTEYRKHA
ncbi:MULTISPECIES: AraC family transcriptional regulator [Kordiimonas]|uniref:AraC family transcriptional regulator n=1 Tax=Kordiimonas TaxID=288021 RepID=UPI001FF49B93|nr:MULTISPECIES: AraC family transcriptional regulator [Kordiimonas]MCK0069015.1 AraC family transcriptional regulator [Kordiimonas laminariae]UTW58356.1 AraC family transcriptional regulator [Kordiimonas sp. SCSIO 12603]